MSPKTAETSLKNVLAHLRNKNLAVFPSRWTPGLRLAERLAHGAESLRIRFLAAAGWEVVVSEQTVEVPLLLRELGPEGSSILDFGGYESTLPLSLSALGYHVTVLDQRPYPFRHPRLHTVCADLFGDHLSLDTQFDLVMSISTIEHLGLGHYAERARPNGDREGVERLWGLVRPGGRLVASVPAGRPSEQRGYRTYDEARLRSTFPHATRICWYRKNGRTGWWDSTDAAGIAELVYSKPAGNVPVEAVAFVISEKPSA
jgi:SAM-dependent methyltransferase